MTTRYVDGTGAGNDAYDGLAKTWDGAHGPKATLNGCEDSTVAAGDLCHVRSGTYRELLTCDVSGAAGQAIEYRGDYSGAVWGDAGGVVRITGAASPDQTRGTRANCIDVGARSYRTFRGFTLDGTSLYNITSAASESDVTIDECWFQVTPTVSGVYANGANQLRWTVTNCMFQLGYTSRGVHFNNAADVSNAGHVVSNCVFDGGSGSDQIRSDNVGGIAVSNCTFYGGGEAVRVAAALAAGQTVTVNNCAMMSLQTALLATVAGELVEDYNTISNCNTARSNVNTGANSNVYPWLPDTRWFHEATNGGRFVTPFDMASYCALVEVADNAPTATDMRGTAVQGSEREIGALEYDSTLLIESAAGGGGMLKADKRGGKQ